MIERESGAHLGPWWALRPEVQTMVLEGELSIAELAEVGQALQRLLRRGFARVVVDLTDVSYVDPAGLRPLIQLGSSFRRAGGDLKVAGMNGFLSHLFRAGGANVAFEFFASADNARHSFGPIRLAS